jgi:hypothetical protein
MPKPQARVRLAEYTYDFASGTIISEPISITQEKTILESYGKIINGMQRILNFQIPLDEKLQLLKKSWKALEEFIPE